MTKRMSIKVQTIVVCTLLVLASFALTNKDHEAKTGPGYVHLAAGSLVKFAP